MDGGVCCLLLLYSFPEMARGIFVQDTHDGMISGSLEPNTTPLPSSLASNSPPPQRHEYRDCVILPVTDVVMSTRELVLIWAAATMGINGGSGTAVALRSGDHRQLQTCAEVLTACADDVWCNTCNSCESTFRGPLAMYLCMFSVCAGFDELSRVEALGMASLSR